MIKCVVFAIVILTAFLFSTDGQQCETCILGFYRPAGVESSDAEPCVSCNCNTEGSTGIDCVKVTA